MKTTFNHHSAIKRNEEQAAQGLPMNGISPDLLAGIQGGQGAQEQQNTVTEE